MVRTRFTRFWNFFYPLDLNWRLFDDVLLKARLLRLHVLDLFKGIWDRYNFDELFVSDAIGVKKYILYLS